MRRYRVDEDKFETNSILNNHIFARRIVVELSSFRRSDVNANMRMYISVREIQL